MNRSRGCGKYRILDQLGSGSSGVVYLVEQPDLGRKVAVKVCKPSMRRAWPTATSNPPP
jgi:serine/threonine protein kinase